jgi:virulence activator alpha
MHCGGGAWPRDTAPDRSDAALRTFFLWLLEAAEAREQLEGERVYWQSVLDGFLRIRDEPTGHNKRARTFRIALEGGIRTVEARLAWPPTRSPRSTRTRGAGSIPAESPQLHQRSASHAATAQAWVARARR